MRFDDVRELVGDHVIDLILTYLYEASVEQHALAIVRHAAPPFLETTDGEDGARDRLGIEEREASIEPSGQHATRLRAIPPIQSSSNTVRIVSDPAYNKAVAIPVHAAFFGVHGEAVLTSEIEVRLAGNITARRACAAGTVRNLGRLEESTRRVSP